MVAKLSRVVRKAANVVPRAVKGSSGLSNGGGTTVVTSVANVRVINKANDVIAAPGSSGKATSRVASVVNAAQASRARAVTVPVVGVVAVDAVGEAIARGNRTGPATRTVREARGLPMNLPTKPAPRAAKAARNSVGNGVIAAPANNVKAMARAANAVNAAKASKGKGATVPVAGVVAVDAVGVAVVKAVRVESGSRANSAMWHRPVHRTR